MELLICFLMVEQNTVKQMRGDAMDVLLPADYKGLKRKWWKQEDPSSYL